MPRVHYTVNKLKLVGEKVMPLSGFSLNRFLDGKLLSTQQFCTLDGALDYAKVNGIVISNAEEFAV